MPDSSPANWTMAKLRSTPTWARWTVSVVLVYGLLGFFLLPWLAERQLSNLASQRLSLDLSIERFYFNPFTMLLEVENLRTVDVDGSPLVELGLLRSNFSPLRLALLRLHFTEFQIADLDTWFTRVSSSENTAAILAERWQASAAPAAEQAQPEPDTGDSGAIIPLQIDLTRFDNINLHFRDEVPGEPFDTVLTLAEARIDGLSSIENRRGSNTLLLRFENDASLEWSGGLQLNPLDFNGQISLNNFTLELIDNYVRDSLPLSISDGRLAFSTRYDLRFPDGAVQFTLDETALTLSNLAVTQTDRSDPFLGAGQLQINNGRFAYPQNTASLDAITLSGLDLQLDRDANGDINIMQMLAAITGDSAGNNSPSAEPAPADSAAGGWDLNIARFQLTESSVGFVDAALAQPTSLNTGLAMELSNISNQPDARMPFSLQLTPSTGGELSASGATGFLPDLILEADTRIAGLDLTALQPYVNEYTFLSLDQGTLASDLTLTVNPTTVARVQGDLALDGFSTSEQQLAEPIVSWERIAVDGIDLEMATNTLEISEVIFDQLFGRVVINEDSSTNIGRSVRPATAATGTETPETADPATAADPALPLDVIVGRIQVNNARSDFTDRDLPIVFNANISELNGTADGFSTRSAEPLSLNLEGNVDEFGQLQLSSALNPLNVTARSQVRLQFRNLDLPSVSPYTIKFAGREISNGNVDIDLQYEVTDGQLDASNQVVLRDLRLGARIEQPGAMNLPLDLATALLKDSNGVIDLEIPISGDVSDPQFDLGPAIRTAITNVLTNIVAAPFRLLGGLIGNADADLEHIQFQPGSATVAPPEREILTQLVNALIQRPELVLEIPPLQGEGDRAALQQQAVSARIDEQLEQTAEADGSLTDRRLAIVEQLYQQAALTPTLEELRQANSLMPETTDNGTVDLAAALTAGELDVPAYVQDLRSRLIAAEPVSEAALADLAESRQQAVMAYLGEQGLDVSTRTVAADAQVSELNDNGRLTMEFGLTAQRRN